MFLKPVERLLHVQKLKVLVGVGLSSSTDKRLLPVKNVLEDAWSACGAFKISCGHLFNILKLQCTRPVLESFPFISEVVFSEAFEKSTFPAHLL